MKSTFKKILVAMLIISCFVSVMIVPAHAAFGREYYAPKGTPEVDGVMEELWDKAEWTNVDKPFDGKDPADVPASLRVKLLWDEAGLYVYAEVVDSKIHTEEDLVEIYIDEDNSKRSMRFDNNDSQTRINYQGKFKEGGASGTNSKYMVPTSKAAGERTEVGYNVEAFLPWTNKFEAEANKILGLEFMLNIADPDVTENAGFTDALRWNVDSPGGDEQPSKSPKHWGILVLADEEGNWETTEKPAETEPPVTEAPATEAPTTDKPATKPTTTKPVKETEPPVSVNEDDFFNDQDKEDESKINPIIFVAIGAAVVVAVVVVVIVVKKKKK